MNVRFGWLAAVAMGMVGCSALPKLIKERTDDLVRSLEEAEKIPEKFRKDFDRSRMGDDLK